MHTAVFHKRYIQSTTLFLTLPLYFINIVFTRCSTILNLKIKQWIFFKGGKITEVFIDMLLISDST